MNWEKADLYTRRLFVALVSGFLICSTFYLSLTAGMSGVYWALFVKSPNFKMVGIAAGTGAFWAGIAGHQLVVSFLKQHLLPPSTKKQ